MENAITNKTSSKYKCYLYPHNFGENWMQFEIPVNILFNLKEESEINDLPEIVEVEIGSEIISGTLITDDPFNSCWQLNVVRDCGETEMIEIKNPFYTMKVESILGEYATYMFQKFCKQV